MPPFMLTVGHNIVLNNNALIKHPAVIVLTESERNEIPEMESFGKFVGKNFTTARERVGGQVLMWPHRQSSVVDCAGVAGMPDLEGGHRENGAV